MTPTRAIFFCTLLLMNNNFCSCMEKSIEIKQIGSCRTTSNDSQPRNCEIDQLSFDLEEIQNDFDSIANVRNNIESALESSKVIKSNRRKNQHNIAPINDLTASTLKKIKRLNQKLKHIDPQQSFIQKKIDEINKQLLYTGNLVALKNKDNISKTHRKTMYKAIIEEEKKTSRRKTTHKSYYIFASKKALNSNKLSSTKNTISQLGQTEKMTATIHHKVLTDIDYVLGTNIYFSSKKPKILSTHTISSYKLKKRGNACVLKIENPDLFWSKSKLLVIEK